MLSQPIRPAALGEPPNPSRRKTRPRTDCAPASATKLTTDPMTSALNGPPTGVHYVCIAVHGGLHVPGIVGLGSQQRSARPWRCHEPVLGIAGLGVSAMTLGVIEVSVALGAFVVMYVASVHHRHEQEDHQEPGPGWSRPAR